MIVFTLETQWIPRKLSHMFKDIIISLLFYFWRSCLPLMRGKVPAAIPGNTFGHKDNQKKRDLFLLKGL